MGNIDKNKLHNLVQDFLKNFVCENLKKRSHFTAEKSAVRKNGSVFKNMLNLGS